MIDCKRNLTCQCCFVVSTWMKAIAQADDTIFFKNSLYILQHNNLKVSGPVNIKLQNTSAKIFEPAFGCAHAHGSYLRFTKQSMLCNAWNPFARRQEAAVSSQRRSASSGAACEATPTCRNLLSCHGALNLTFAIFCYPSKVQSWPRGRLFTTPTPLEIGNGVAEHLDNVATTKSS